MTISFRLDCGIQSYAWGKQGKSSTVAYLAQNSSKSFEMEESMAYAELWMGTHKSCPSKNYETGIPLNEICQSSPVEILSNEVYDKYADIPFLFKVLSVDKALSIQAHPDKVLAKRLHEDQPQVYKDPNHKPEMAIALTEFEALCGFRPLEEITNNLKAFPELESLIDRRLLNEFFTNANKSGLKEIFRQCVSSEQGLVTVLVEKISERLKQTSNHFTKGSCEELFFRLSNQYPGDVGCFCVLFLNYVCLKEDEAVFLSANEPHAYLSGDCVEIMASSDNVVRAGLTPKFKDVETLIAMLTYKSHQVRDLVILGNEIGPSSKKFDSPVEEFAVIKHSILAGSTCFLDKCKGPSILLVVKGTGVIKTGQEKLSFLPGFVFFIGDRGLVEIQCAEEFKGFQAVVNIQV